MYILLMVRSLAAKMCFSQPIDNIYSFHGKNQFRKSIWGLIFLYSDTFLVPIWYIFHRLRSGFCNILVCTSIFRKKRGTTLVFLKSEPISSEKTPLFRWNEVWEASFLCVYLATNYQCRTHQPPEQTEIYSGRK